MIRSAVVREFLIEERGAPLQYHASGEAAPRLQRTGVFRHRRRNRTLQFPEIGEAFRNGILRDERSFKAVSAELRQVRVVPRYKMSRDSDDECQLENPAKVWTRTLAEARE